MPCQARHRTARADAGIDGDESRRRAAIGLLGLLFVVCGPALRGDEGNAEDLAALAERARHFSTAYTSADVDAIVSIYTEDAVLAPGDSEFIVGREAIRAYWTRPKGNRITHHEITPVAVEVVGDTAYDYGHYELSGVNRNEDGERAWGPNRGKYLVVWKRGADGVWRMAVDMWNTRPRPEGNR